MDFLKIKLKRAHWMSLLKQNKIQEAIQTYTTYIAELQNYKKEDNFKIEAEKEEAMAKEILLKELSEISKANIEKGNYIEALPCCEYIFQIRPEDTNNIEKYIKCVNNIEQYDLQLALAKYYYDKFHNLNSIKEISEANDKSGNYHEAIKYYNEYLEKSPKDITANDYNVIGCHYFNAYVRKTKEPDDAVKALEYFEKAVELLPRSQPYIKNTIFAAMKAKNWEKENEYWKMYFDKGFADKEDEFVYAASCLRNKEILKWEQLYESRFQKNKPTIYPKFKQPKWNGTQDLTNKTLLVHYEQGFGDSFLMFGYMPRLVKLAKKVIFYIQSGAYELIKDNDFGVEASCFNIVQDPTTLKFDYHIPAMSIPYALKLDINNISVGSGYIKPNKELVQKFKEKYFNNNNYKIGLSFSGNKSENSNTTRDIPIEKLLPLDNLENVSLYCFTKDTEDVALSCFKRNKVINVVKDCKNFEDTAAAMENLDILISSDNGVMNLAGAIGKKTLALFHYHYEFRWYDLNDKDVGWYDCIRPIINNPYDNWDLSIQKAIDIIKEEMSKK